jgi:hypothetical protein
MGEGEGAHLISSGSVFTNKPNQLGQKSGFNRPYSVVWGVFTGVERDATLYHMYVIYPMFSTDRAGIRLRIINDVKI